MSATKTRAARIKEASSARRQRKKAETRRAILDAATALFLEQGHDQFSLRQVSEAIGYSPTTIYLYFKDKEDLLFHAALDGFIRFAAALQQAYDGHTDPWERLLAEGRAYVSFGLENPLHYRLMFMRSGELLNKDMPVEECDSIADSFEILHQTIRECLNAGYLLPGDSRSYAALIWSAVHGLVALHLGTQSVTKEETYQLLEMYQTLQLAALRQ